MERRAALLLMLPICGATATQDVPARPRAACSADA